MSKYQQIAKTIFEARLDPGAEAVSESDTTKRLDGKQLISIRLDRDIVAFFKKDGSRWQTRMNDALREWMMGQKWTRE